MKGKAQAKVHKVMREFKSGELHSGSASGPTVTSREQAVAIALSEARKKMRRHLHVESSK
jgi:hypothetical protein